MTSTNDVITRRRPHIDMDYFQGLDPKVASQFVSKCFWGSILGQRNGVSQF